MVSPRKRFLQRVYEDWRDRLAAALPGGPGRIVELGAGDGRMPPVHPGALRCDVRSLAGLDLLADACRLPFASSSLQALVMTDVLHHVSDAGAFFAEAAHALRPGGVIAMVEPWRTSWSEFVYSRFHHELFDPSAPSWTFDSVDPSLDANGALPWIVFVRDRARFEREHTPLRIETIEPIMPLRYLLSGGLSSPSLQPGWMFPAWTALENAFSPLSRRAAMFAFILLRKA